jgi:hypothetical protein
VSDGAYNCIAWAAGDAGAWWWPLPEPSEAYWPPSIPRVETLEAFYGAFATLGYVERTREDLEAGFEKVALFADEQGIPTHASRQLPSGLWTSKLGAAEDIEHNLRDLEGDIYGTVVAVLKRPLLASPSPAAAEPPPASLTPSSPGTSPTAPAPSSPAS